MAAPSGLEEKIEENDEDTNRDIDLRGLKGTSFTKTLIEAVHNPRKLDLRGMLLRSGELNVLETYLLGIDLGVSIEFLDMRGTRGKDKKDAKKLISIMKLVTELSSTIVDSIGVGPAVINVKQIREGKLPLLDLSNDINIIALKNLGMEDGSSHHNLDEENGVQEDKSSQIISPTDLLQLAEVLYPMGFGALNNECEFAPESFSQNAPLYTPKLNAVKLIHTWIPLSCIALERHLKVKSKGLVSKLRSSISKPIRVTSEASLSDDDLSIDPEELRLWENANRLLSGFGKWLDKTKFRLVDVFRSQALNKADGDDTLDEDTLDEEEVFALFAQAEIQTATEQAVADLITYLDKDGDRQLGLTELEKSLRYLKRGEKLPHRIIIKDSHKLKSALLIDEATAARVQSKLKAATYGTDPLKFFAKFDKDKEGSLDRTEFTRMVRTGLKIAPKDLSDRDISSLVDALDNDGGGSLDLNELADFVVRGYAALLSSKSRPGTSWGAPTEESNVFKEAAAKRKQARKKQPVINPEVISKLQRRLQAACYGTDPKTFFRRLDKDKGGSLDAEEFKRLIRRTLRVSKEELSDKDLLKLVALLDGDGGGELDVEELALFVEKGAEAFATKSSQSKDELDDASRPKTPPLEPYRRPPPVLRVWDHMVDGGAYVNFSQVDALIKQRSLFYDISSLNVLPKRKVEMTPDHEVFDDNASLKSGKSIQSQNSNTTKANKNEIDFKAEKLAVKRRKAEPLFSDDFALLKAFLNIRERKQESLELARLKYERQAQDMGYEFGDASIESPKIISSPFESTGDGISKEAEFEIEPLRTLSLAGCKIDGYKIGWLATANFLTDLLCSTHLVNEATTAAGGRGSGNNSSNASANGSGHGGSNRSSVSGLPPSLIRRQSSIESMDSKGGGGGSLRRQASFDGSLDSNMSGSNQDDALNKNLLHTPSQIRHLDLRGCFDESGELCHMVLSNVNDKTDRTNLEEEIIGGAMLNHSHKHNINYDNNKVNSILGKQYGALFLGEHLGEFAARHLLPETDRQTNNLNLDNPSVLSLESPRSQHSVSSSIHSAQSPNKQRTALTQSQPASFSNPPSVTRPTEGDVFNSVNVFTVNSLYPPPPPKGLSLSRIPLDFSVLMELHLPSCGLGPFEAGVIATLLRRQWKVNPTPLESVVTDTTTAATGSLRTENMKNASPTKSKEDTLNRASLEEVGGASSSLRQSNQSKSKSSLKSLFGDANHNAVSNTSSSSSNLKVNQQVKVEEANSSTIIPPSLSDDEKEVFGQSALRVLILCGNPLGTCGVSAIARAVSGRYLRVPKKIYDDLHKRKQALKEKDKNKKTDEIGDKDIDNTKAVGSDVVSSTNLDMTNSTPSMLQKKRSSLINMTNSNQNQQNQKRASLRVGSGNSGGESFKQDSELNLESEIKKPSDVDNILEQEEIPSKPIDAEELEDLIILDDLDEKEFGKTHASKRIPSNLTSLDIRATGCDENAFSEIAAVLRHNHNLLRFDFRRNSFASGHEKDAYKLLPSNASVVGGGSSNELRVKAKLINAAYTVEIELAEALLVRHEDGSFNKKTSKSQAKSGEEKDDSQSVSGGGGSVESKSQSHKTSDKRSHRSRKKADKRGVMQGGGGGVVAMQEEIEPFCLPLENLDGISFRRLARKCISRGDKILLAPRLNCEEVKQNGQIDMMKGERNESRQAGEGNFQEGVYGEREEVEEGGVLDDRITETEFRQEFFAQYFPKFPKEMVNNQSAEKSNSSSILNQFSAQSKDEVSLNSQSNGLTLQIESIETLGRPSGSGSGSGLTNTSVESVKLPSSQTYAPSGTQVSSILTNSVADSAVPDTASQQEPMSQKKANHSVASQHLTPTQDASTISKPPSSTYQFNQSMDDKVELVLDGNQYSHALPIHNVVFACLLAMRNKCGGITIKSVDFPGIAPTTEPPKANTGGGGGTFKEGGADTKDQATAGSGKSADKEAAHFFSDKLPTNAPTSTAISSEGISKAPFVKSTTEYENTSAGNASLESTTNTAAGSLKQPMRRKSGSKRRASFNQEMAQLIEEEKQAQEREMEEKLAQEAQEALQRKSVLTDSQLITCGDCAVLKDKSKLKQMDKVKKQLVRNFNISELEEDGTRQRLFREKLAIVGRTFRALRYGAFLKSLSLIDCALGPDGTALLAKELLLDRTITRLDLEGALVCGVDGRSLEGLKVLCSVFAPKSGRSPNHNLVHLGLANNVLGVEAAEMIGQCLLAEPSCHLSTLVLSKNKLGGFPGYEKLCNGLSCHPSPWYLQKLFTDYDLSFFHKSLKIQQNDEVKVDHVSYSQRKLKRAIQMTENALQLVIPESFLSASSESSSGNTSAQSSAAPSPMNTFRSAKSSSRNNGSGVHTFPNSTMDQKSSPNNGPSPSSVASSSSRHRASSRRPSPAPSPSPAMRKSPSSRSSFGFPNDSGSETESLNGSKGNRSSIRKSPSNQSVKRESYSKAAKSPSIVKGSGSITPTKNRSRTNSRSNSPTRQRTGSTTSYSQVQKNEKHDDKSSKKTGKEEGDVSKTKGGVILNDNLSRDDQGEEPNSTNQISNTRPIKPICNHEDDKFIGGGGGSKGNMHTLNRVRIRAIFKFEEKRQRMKLPSLEEWQKKHKHLIQLNESQYHGDNDDDVHTQKSQQSSKEGGSVLAIGYGEEDDDASVASSLGRHSESSRNLVDLDDDLDKLKTMGTTDTLESMDRDDQSLEGGVTTSPSIEKQSIIDGENNASKGDASQAITGQEASKQPEDEFNGIKAFLPSREEELKFAVHRFQLLLTKVDDGSASFNEKIELEGLCEVITEIRTPKEPPRPPAARPLTISQKRKLNQSPIP